MKKDTIVVISFSAAKQKQTYTGHKNDTICVAFPMSSGTGFVWEVMNKPALCIQRETSYESIKKNRPGSSVKEIMTFILTTKGTEDIQFIYHRPFEKNKPGKIKTLHLIVR